ncbi:hypothetical protein Sfulv_61360 [Streptomyces fulvorobeus]|uniref:Uncharacterized protein n=1 Tax=Streptomyces fulvorobeus TaxID=284028 RepID=A0A7J0CFR9_9ACTN|nr:hypothetical protein [Streptomyces fulvorobeus]GFN01326.1 hypothetical protein Sfulv_61360 [Streptomyces fulvorobeus]
MTVSVMALGCLGQAPAHASGTTEDGPVGIGVLGEGLKVREVRATLDGWEAGAQARVSLWKGDSYVRMVRGWTYTSSTEGHGHKFEVAKWKINKSFPHRSRLCVEFKGHDRMPCVTIKR